MEEAAGYILFHDGPKGRRFLLLRNRRHGAWGFPKGRLEDGEDHAAGADRQVPHRQAEQPERGDGPAMVRAVGRGRVNPPVYLRPMAQAVSSRPAAMTDSQGFMPET